MVVLPSEDGVNEAQSKPDSNWPKDQFGRREVSQFLNPLGLSVIAGVAILTGMLLPAISYSKPHPEVVAYVAQDQIYAEPIFRDFEKETGIKVLPVFDSEAVKTVGMANRLLAEKSHPQCDVFWGNEEMRTRQLAAQNVFRQTNGWATFGYRSRRMVINTNLLSVEKAPHSLLELTNKVWTGKVAFAYPQFGTTAAHFHALRQLWGDAGWESWCRALAANKPLVVDGNSVVVKMVGKGEAVVGMTDSDDIADSQREGLPVAEMGVTEETLLIPNSVGLVRNSPHIAESEKLFEYLQKPKIAAQLVEAHALEGVSEATAPRSALKPDWAALLRDLEPTTKRLSQIFLR
ncbi:MAG TPA: ABC transporter substrate-binding protein [Candidatus Dormibacteraeota bacterium]|nr:ABC transporter substrate-binding protein [Candidatus Dormibacteraeota bacterium]